MQAGGTCGFRGGGSGAIVVYKKRGGGERVPIWEQDEEARIRAAQERILRERIR